EFQEAEFHDALFHEADACAALIQAVQSKPPVAVTKASSARFGFGASGRFAARLALTSPTPPARPSDRSMFCAVSISAPLTWSGVNPGCRARTSAAAPATTGAANDVPESCMYPCANTLPGRSVQSVEPTGAGPTR